MEKFKQIKILNVMFAIQIDRVLQVNKLAKATYGVKSNTNI